VSRRHPAVPLHAHHLIATVNVAIVKLAPDVRIRPLFAAACFSGGAPVPAEIARRWEALTGYKLIEGYGLSRDDRRRPHQPPTAEVRDVAVPLPLVDAKIVSLDDGRTELTRANRARSWSAGR